jgi:hypothetical protein
MRSVTACILPEGRRNAIRMHPGHASRGDLRVTRTFRPKRGGRWAPADALKIGTEPDGKIWKIWLK